MYDLIEHKEKGRILMSKRKRLLTKNILCAVMAASVVTTGSMALAAEVRPEYDDFFEYTGEYTIDNGIFYSTNEDKVSSVRVIGDGTKLTLNNPIIRDGEAGPDMGATMIVNGGSISASNLNSEGGTLIVNDAEINSPQIFAGYLYKDEYDDEGSRYSRVEINNTNINDNKLIAAGINSEVILNGSQNSVYTVSNFIGSIAERTNNIKLGGAVKISGGTLKADNLRSILNGSGITPELVNMSASEVNEIKTRVVKNGGVILTDNGVIETKTGQIYEHGIDTTSDEMVLDSTDSGKVTNDYISYEGGTINFTDEKYTQSYLDSAIVNMAEKGSTKINMLGTMINEQGEVVEDITVDDAVANENVQTNATVNTNSDITNLVVGNGTTDTETQYSNGSFRAAKLAVGENTSAIEIKDGQSMGLGGKNGGALITGNKGDLNITVNNADSKLTLGREGLNATNSLAANVTVNEGALEAVSGATTVNGDINLKENTVLNVKGDAALTANKTLTAQKNATIKVGDENSTGTFLAENSQLNGADMYISAAYKDGQTIADASKSGLVFDEGKVDGNLNVGENSVLTLGDIKTDLAETAFAKSGQNWGNGENDVLSAAYIASPQDMEKGSLSMNTAETLQNGEVKFGNNSMLMVDASKLDETIAAINNISNAEVAQNTEGKKDGAKLYIDNAENGQSYTILSGTGVEADDKWADENVVADNALLKFTSEDGTNTYTAQYQKVADVFGKDVVASDIVDSAIAINDPKNTAYNFFNQAASDHYNVGNEAKIAAFNSVANMGELAGVNHGTYSMSNTMTDAVADHLSLANHGEQDNDIWARYIHSKEDIEDMKLGGLNANYDATYNGIIVGGDFYKNGKGTVGLAVAYADGDIDGSNMAARTENDAEYYGASLYGRIDNGDSALLGDISFLHSSNDITQYNSGEKITASPDADAFSIGLRAEKEIKAGNGKLVPYAGVRYMHMGAGDYTNSLGMKYDADEQNLFLLPVGLKYTAEIKHNDWTIKPMAEVGYVWNFGDKNTDQTISLNGASNTFGFDTVDDGAFIGRLGIEAENDKMAYGIGYEYQDGDSSSSDKWMANVTFKF